MSLLIKALDKAQAEKAQAKSDAANEKPIKLKVEKLAKAKSRRATAPMSLEAIGKDSSSKSEASQLDDVPQALKGSAADASQQSPTAKNSEITAPTTPTEQSNLPARAQAANVFTAKQAEATNRTAKLAIVIGFIALGVMGALAYWYQSVFNTADIVIPPRAIINQEMPEPLPEVASANELPIAGEAEVVEPDMSEPEANGGEAVENEVIEPESVAELIERSVVPPGIEQSPESIFIQKSSQLTADSKEVEPALEETLTANETVVGSDEALVDSSTIVADLGMASKSASIKMTKQQTTPGVNPVLMRAYEAYKAGNDNQAQQDYMQVLKRYGPNVDAMLGLGAIATRQERLADANGWYRKVLEVEPRNELAKSGLLNIQQGQADQLPANESNIKSMLATAPNDANLHATLGDLYANQQQWPAAQQAYFDAYRLNQSAENAFNLGVSLDQLGKSTLALPYYREALHKAAQSNAIDPEALQARITSIE